MVVDQIVGRIAALAKLGQDHQFLALKLVGIEPRRAHQIGDQLEPQPDIGGQGARMEHRLVARGPGVQ